MNYTKQEQLYEGKAKKVFATESPDYVIVSYKDDATALNVLKRGTIVGKGEVNNRVSNILFAYPSVCMSLDEFLSLEMDVLKGYIIWL